MTTELHAVHCVHFKTEQLQREDRGLVPYITVRHMGLDGEDARLSLLRGEFGHEH